MDIKYFYIKFHLKDGSGIHSLIASIGGRSDVRGER